MPQKQETPQANEVLTSGALEELVETAGFEPASASNQPSALHA